MATLTKLELIAGLTRVGELGLSAKEPIELLLFGGCVMVLVYESRLSTRDVDVVVLAPKQAHDLRAIARTVAIERGWAEDWLNDGVKGFVVGSSLGRVIFSAPGITVRCPAVEQLLAMKLCAWRDDIDIADAKRLLKDLPGTYNAVWNKTIPHLQPGRELTAEYAFRDLWEQANGKD